jgi:L-lactate dehydrogenase (cytochrome)
MTGLHTIEAMRDAARRRLPRFAFDFVDGGSGAESALARNCAAFEAVRLLPRVLTGAVARDPSLELFGAKYALPFGVAPIGLANLAGSGTDLGLAQAALDAGAPYALSTAATTSIETIARTAPGAWFQLYVGADHAIVEDLIDRAEAAGIGTLIVTVDVPAPGKRVRDLVNGFSLPLRPTSAMALDLLAHPGWALDLASNGAPRFANLEAYGGKGAGAQSLARLMAGQSSARLDWALLADIRRRWKGALVVKGVLHPQDAARLAELGADGVVVSNHGGRQLDSAPAPIEALPAVRAAVGPRLPVLLDGGVRRGEDIARAVALGADMVLLGRPFLYAAAARGARRGGGELFAILADELDRAMTQLGASTLAELRQVEVFAPTTFNAAPARPDLRAVESRRTAP